MQKMKGKSSGHGVGHAGLAKANYHHIRLRFCLRVQFADTDTC